MLPPHQQLVAPGKWPTVGEKSPTPWSRPWTVEVGGLVARPQVFTLDELRALPQVERVIDIHCVTRWSKLGVRFSGIPLQTLLDIVMPSAEAKYLSFVARSDRAHSSSLPLTDALALETLIAFSADGELLSELRGGPIRTVVPQRYFYKSLKWLARIELLSEDRLGHWEATAGYHNIADPWLEQRYIAGSLSKQEAALLISSRNFAGRDLLSLDARGHDLAGLDACGALLRNADFRGCNLEGSRFDRANLTNARFCGANLRGASFAAADCEGSDYSGADLREADFRGASLFGATLTSDEAGKPQMNAATSVDASVLEMLTPLQADFVRRFLETAGG